jgi:hypothetical protein
LAHHALVQKQIAAMEQVGKFIIVRSLSHKINVIVMFHAFPMWLCQFHQTSC